MRTEEGLFRYLSGVEATTALIDSGEFCRLYEAELPEEPSYPCVVFEAQSDERPHSFKNAAPTIKDVMFTFSHYAEQDPANADALHDAFYAALMGPTALAAIQTAMATAGGPIIGGVHFMGKRASSVPDFQPATRLFVVETDYRFWVQI